MAKVSIRLSDSEEEEQNLLLWDFIVRHMQYSSKALFIRKISSQEELNKLLDNIETLLKSRPKAELVRFIPSTKDSPVEIFMGYYQDGKSGWSGAMIYPLCYKPNSL